MRAVVCLAALAALAGCAHQAAPVSQATRDIALIDAGLVSAVANIPNAPSSVTIALNDLSTVAASLGAADNPTAAIVQRVEADVNAVVTAATPLAAAIPPPIGPEVQVALVAANALLPAVEAAIGAQLIASVPRSVSPAQARLILAGVAAP